ncbi:adenylyl-sulfate kinase [Halobellus inordinatus]|uniref:adenylyl-sulfate kinase n=1 Tax=Halobellus inordinatus TaxID=1126236 RepID=UPI002109E317|nr:adenylyl-sulfate kinase [Halobellus inordinatus]
MTFTLWFMGRPAAGKSTLASQIEAYLRDQGIQVENLDGDEIRKNLHPDLGFSREDREINNRRTAFIAKLLNRNGIATVTGMITPFRDSQAMARDIVEPDGDFVLIYVKCSVDEAARRDPKNLYEEARAGNIEKFTGINHPFQEPHNPDVIVDTEQNTVDENLEHIKQQLHKRGLLNGDSEGDYGVDMDWQQEQEVLDRLRSLGYIEDSRE